MYTIQEQRKLVDLSKKFLKEEASVTNIEDLRKALIYHEWKYYIQNDPVVSDFEYDIQRVDKIIWIQLSYVGYNYRM